MQYFAIEIGIKVIVFCPCSNSGCLWLLHLVCRQTNNKMYANSRQTRQWKQAHYYYILQFLTFCVYLLFLFCFWLELTFEIWAFVSVLLLAASLSLSAAAVSSSSSSAFVSGSFEALLDLFSSPLGDFLLDCW